MVPLRRRKERLEIWLGLLVLVTAGLLIWGYFWLTGQPLGEPGYSVVVEVPDAQGLESGDRVRISGVEVGSVRRVELAPRGTVFVTLHIGEAVRLPRDSRVVLQSIGVFGDRFIELRPGTADRLVEPGDTLTAAPPAPDLMAAAGQLSEQANEVLARFERLLSDTTVEQVHTTVGSLHSMVSELERLVRQRSDEFARTSQSLSRTAQALEQAVGDGELDSTIAEVRETAGAISAAADSLRLSAAHLASISAKVDDGAGTLGLLVNDPSLYEDLRSTVRSIGDLTRDIRENPGRYLRLAIF